MDIVAARSVRYIVIIGLSLAIILLAALLIFTGYILPLRPSARHFPVLGFDVSNHQGKIDWPKIDSKYRFVIIKATEGDDFVDKRFAENLAGAKARGLVVGAYHYFHFAYDGQKQAENFIKTVQNGIDLPPVIDVEFPSGPADSKDIGQIKAELREMCGALRAHYGVEPIIYTTQKAYAGIISGSFDNPIWLRSILYPERGQIQNTILWQYSDHSRIRGISTVVDLDAFKGNAEEFNKLSTMMKK